METEINFMDELLAEVEVKEERQSETYFDILIKQEFQRFQEPRN